MQGHKTEHYGKLSVHISKSQIWTSMSISDFTLNFTFLFPYSIQLLHLRIHLHWSVLNLQLFYFTEYANARLLQGVKNIIAFPQTPRCTTYFVMRWWFFSFLKKKKSLKFAVPPPTCSSRLLTFMTYFWISPYLRRHFNERAQPALHTF